MSKIYTALGLMSGTSLDGIDVALLRTDGKNVVERGPSATYPYSPAEQARLREGLVAAFAIQDRTDRPNGLAELEADLSEWHVRALELFFEHHDVTNRDIDVVGFHGQTVLHRPEKHLTLQLGLGQSISNVFLFPVVYDMRAADVAAGGQGAPLVPAYHAALGKVRPSAFVNIGGVANVTYIGDDGELLAFDTGPGNALINDWMMKHRNQAFDEGGKVALKGKVSERHIAQALSHGFFQQRPPKSLDRNSFAHLDLSDLSFEDGAATLAAFTVEAISQAERWFPRPPKQWVICGGGRYNQAIMTGLQERLSNVVTAEALGLNGDSMEAEAWAYLAVRCLKGLPITFPGTTGVAAAMTGGKLALAR